jgi:hypothetical protein
MSNKIELFRWYVQEGMGVAGGSFMYIYPILKTSNTYVSRVCFRNHAYYEFISRRDMHERFQPTDKEIDFHEMFNGDNKSCRRVFSGLFSAPEGEI